MKVVWTDHAAEDLREIEDYIASDDPAAAAAFIARLMDRAERLRRFPRRGRVVPELPSSGLRELIEGHYRIVYRIGKGAVFVLTVFEGHRLLKEEDVAGP